MLNDKIPFAKILRGSTNLNATIFDLNGKQIFSAGNSFKNVTHDNQPIDEIRKELSEHSSAFYLNFQLASGIHYLATGLFEKKQLEGWMTVGPFVTGQPSSAQIDEILASNQLTVSERKALTSFYDVLPFLSDDQAANTGLLLVNLMQKDYVEVTSQNYVQPKRQMSSDVLRQFETTNVEEILQRYRAESEFMNQVSFGDVSALSNRNVTARQLTSMFGQRVPDNPLRSLKNMSFVLNTLARISAKKGEVNPVVLHQISEKYETLIERQTSVADLQNLAKKMVFEYTEAVHETVTDPYSPFIKRAADELLLNLGHPIKLTDLAKELKVDPSYLSRKFKQVTGNTVTEFVNESRIRVAQEYLLRGENSITEISLMLGFNDVSYFTRVFKKETGVTPTEYQQNPNITF